MKRLFRKLFPKKPTYKPAGTIRNGSFTFRNYRALGTLHGSYHVWQDNQYLGEYFGQQIEIVEQLFYSDPQSVTGSPQTDEQHPT